MLTDRDMERYDRQILLDHIGRKGQEKLKKARVAIVGAGGLGTAASLYLAAAGIGKMTIIDCQVPELSNLNRQVLHWEEDVAMTNKAESIKEKLSSLNSDIQIEAITEKITTENIDVLKDATIIVDCLDNFSTRYSLNEFCVKNQKPLVHAAVEGFYGQLTTIIPSKTPCLKCIFPKMTDKEIFPIIGVTTGLFGALEANEVIKLITDAGEVLAGKLLFYDLLSNSFDIIEIKKNEKCEVCANI
ncbi:MAG: HesA/MoeB/ThiF family protein [Methanosarcinales archaeon]|nr:MAG: HesA/MoeB/ThiF family protein [Methanosarcinales archaeon]